MRRKSDDLGLDWPTAGWIAATPAAPHSPGRGAIVKVKAYLAVVFWLSPVLDTSMSTCSRQRS